MDFLVPVVVWLNALANGLGSWLLAPIGFLPAWLSATVVAALTGVALLVVFKYTSNQRALKRVKNDIKANLLALKFFKESASVAVHAQGRIFRGAVLLLVHALVPMLVMLLPVFLVLSQLALWYEWRPLRVDEEAVVTLKLNGDRDTTWPSVHLEPSDGIETTIGPVRVRSKREICWNVKARTNGYQRLVFHVGEQTENKELAVGDGYMRVSPLRPGWHTSDALLYPAERPFGPDSAVQSIEIDYPQRSSLSRADHSWLTSWFAVSMSVSGWLGKLFGLPAWMIYWFVVSMIAGLCFRGWLKVNI